jgi:hypothetical protein
MTIKLNRGSRSRIKNSVMDKIGCKKKKLYAPKKILITAAVFAVFALTVTVAAINNFFTFIPGFGIVENNDSTIYAMEAVTRRINSKDSRINAEIISAVYQNDYLSATVSVTGKALYYEDFTIFVNGNPIDYREKGSSSLSISSDSAMLFFSHKLSELSEDDIFEIALTGFDEKISFKMTPCLDYDDVAKIGPTDIQNNISITTTAERIDNQLIVWCYPFKLENAVKDRIIGYGVPINVGWSGEQIHIVTSKERIPYDISGWKINERFVFEITEEDSSATLHIPFLTMYREEKKKFSISLPKNYGTEESNVSVKTSLGIIKITEVKREINEYYNDKDTIWIQLEYDSNDGNMKLYRFDLDMKGVFSSYACHSHEENGTIEYLEVDVGKNDKKITLNLTGLYYYLMGEYIIELDING